MADLTGQSIGRYHIIEPLGEGGMATVYKAYDTRLERNVAVKVLRTDQFIPAQLQMVLQRFEREAKSLAKLSNPNIVNILDFGEHEGMPYLVMEYLPGGTLKQKTGSAVPWREALRVLLPVAQGLSYAHSHGVIHRDVKPANILMNEDGRPILTDFGIAKLLEAPDGHTLTGSGVGIGTPEYMAPEQGIGASAIDERADVYSLGIVLYELVTGRKPYIADTPMAVVLKQMTDPLPHPTDFAPDLPESVEHILLKALAKEPENRFADMEAVIDAMEVALAEIPLAIPSGQWGAQKAGLSAKWFAVIPAVLALIFLAVVGIPILRQMSAPAPEVEPTWTPIIYPTSFQEQPARPTATLAGAPGTAEAAEALSQSVLAYFALQPPTFEDDFSKSDMGWGGTSEGLALFALVQDGVLTVTDHSGGKDDGGMKPDHYIPGATFPINGLLDAGDFALQFDFKFETDQAADELAVQFRAYRFSIGQDGSWELIKAGAISTPHVSGGDADLQPGNNTLLLVMYKDSMGIYLNNILLHSLSGITTEGRENRISVTGKHGSTMDFDNFKFWNLDD